MGVQTLNCSGHHSFASSTLGSADRVKPCADNICGGNISAIKTLMVAIAGNLTDANVRKPVVSRILTLLSFLITKPLKILKKLPSPGV